jgi:hypothetical protein
MNKLLPIVTLLLAISGISRAQDFPVQVTTIVTPPYSLYLSDYASPENTALQVMVQLKELDRPEYRVKLRLTIEGQGITLRTKASYVPRALVLQGGIPEMLTGPDLSGYLNPNNLEFIGTTQQAFMRTGMFPEGFYTFKVEVLDYVRGVLVSNAGLGNAFIILNDPPLINLPFNNDKITATDPQNIIFSWTPRHTASPNAAFSTEYEFTLVELYPANRNPEDAIRASNSIYVAQTSYTSLNYGVIEPLLIPGRKYAFRIRAFDTSGRDLFKNNGYSEVHVFQYGDACVAPVNVKAEPLDPARIKITWDAQDAFTNHGIQLRRKGATNWEEQSTLGNSLIVPGLEANTTYEYKVKGVCGSVQGAYSPLATVLTPTTDTAAFACGTPLPQIQLNTTPLQRELGLYDIIKTADFDIILTQVTANPDGTYKGTGRAMVPWFKYAGVRVKFSNIKVNEERRVYEGNVTTIYTKDSRFVLSIDASNDAPNEENVPDSGAPPAFNGLDTVLTVPVATIGLPSPTSPVIVVTTESGQTIEIPREKNEDGSFKETRITDSNGDTWTVDSNGTIRQGPNVAPPAPFASRDSVNFLVNFAAAENQFYGFDLKHYVDVPADKLSLNNQDYWVAWKSVEAGRQDYVGATATGKNTFPAGIGFKTPSGPVVGEPGSSAASKRVSVMGLVSENVEALTAYVRVQTPGQQQAQEVEVGRLNVKAYDKVLKKLIVVPVNMESAPVTATGLSTELNKIYGQAIVGWEVEVEEGITVDPAMLTGLDVGESGILASFPEKMLSFVRTFRNDVNRFVDGDAYYIFLVNSPDATRAGFMPFKRQFGFVFTNKASNITTAIAHELGHGAFNLRHTFSPEAFLKAQGTTANLMDYNNGRELKKYQWDLVRSPENVNEWFEGDEESALNNGTITERLEALKQSTGFDYFAIVHCETCEDENAGSNIVLPKQHNILDFSRISKLSESSFPFRLPSTSGNKQLVADKLESVVNGPKACFIIYFKSADNQSFALSQSETGFESSTITIQVPQLVIYDSNDNIQKIDCTTELADGWGRVICPADGSNGDSGALMNLVTNGYLENLLTHVENCIKEGGSASGRIINYASSRLSVGDSEFLTQLLNGDKSLSWGPDNELRHNLKAQLIVTDYLSGEEALSQAQTHTVPEGEIKIWIHKNEEGLWELKSNLPEKSSEFFNVKQEDEIDAFSLSDLMDYLNSTAELAVASVDFVATGLYEFFDWSSAGISQARIPDYAWNCDKAGYDERYSIIYKYASRIFNPIDGLLKYGISTGVAPYIDNAQVKNCITRIADGQVDLAFYCGLWNGVIEVGRSIPELGKLIIGPLSRKGREDFSNFLSQLSRFKKEDAGGKIECEGTWCAIKTGLGEQFDPTKCCQFAEIIGELVVPIAIAWIDPAALAGAVEGTSARVILQIVKTMQWLDKIGDPFQYIGGSLRFVNPTLSVVRTEVGRILVRIENQTLKARIFLDNGFSELTKSIDEVAMVTENGILLARYSDGGISKTAKVVSSEIVQILESRGVSLSKLSNLAKQLDDVSGVLNRLEKSGLEFQDLNKFIDDLVSSSDLRSHFKSLDVIGNAPQQLVESWKRALDNGFPEFWRQDPGFLSKLRNVWDYNFVNGTNAKLPNVVLEPTQLTKVSAETLQELRNTFNTTIRTNFRKSLGNNSNISYMLKKAGFTDAEIPALVQRLQSGEGIPGYQVHHKIPLDFGGTNDFSNLVLMKQTPYHSAFTSFQNSQIDIPVGQTQTVNFPRVTGSFYSPPYIE